MIAARAERNAGVNIVAANSSTTRARSGTSGTIIAPTSTARAEPQATMTACRG